MRDLFCFILALFLLGCLAGLAIGTLALAALMVAWPLGVSPNAYPLVWKAILLTCLVSASGIVIPGVILRLNKAIRG
jgi:hypothetical protein